MRNVCGCRHFYDLENICELLQRIPRTLAAVSEQSCGGDVEEELVLEFDDSLVKVFSSHSWSAVAFDHCPTGHSLAVLAFNEFLGRT